LTRASIFFARSHAKMMDRRVKPAVTTEGDEGFGQINRLYNSIAAVTGT
jgi:hypothetical protein